MEEKSNLIQRRDGVQLQAALSRLEPYMALTQNNNRRFQSGIGLQISDQFDDVSLKRTSLFNSTVQDSSFINSALTGSYFSETKFSNSRFCESNFQYCHFIHAAFGDVKICLRIYTQRDCKRNWNPFCHNLSLGQQLEKKFE